MEHLPNFTNLTMKLFVIYAATVAFALYNSDGLNAFLSVGEDDLYEIVDLIPLENMTLLAQSYIENDAQYQELVAYLQSDEYATIRAEISANEDWQALKDWVSAGSPIDIDNVLDTVIAMLQGETLNTIEGQRQLQTTSSRTIQDYFNEAGSLMPLDDIRYLILYKIQTSLDFAVLYAYLSSHEMKALADPVLEIPQVVEVMDKLRAWDVNIDAVIQAIWNLFFGWGK